MKKSKWMFTTRMIVSAGFLVLALAIILNALFDSIGVYSIWDLVGVFVRIAVPAALLVYVLAGRLYARNLRTVYVAAIGAMTAWSMFIAFDALSSISNLFVKDWIDIVEIALYVRDWIEIALYASIFLCCTLVRQHFKTIKSIGKLLFLIVTIIYIIICIFLGFWYFNRSLHDGLPWFSAVIYAVQLLRWEMAYLSIDAAVWMLFPTVMVSSLSLGASRTHDVEASLLQLKEDYENGYMGQKEYADMQAALLEKL